MRRNLFLIFGFIITAITVTDVAWGQTWTQIEPAVGEYQVITHVPADGKNVITGRKGDTLYLFPQFRRNLVSNYFCFAGEFEFQFERVGECHECGYAVRVLQSSGRFIAPKWECFLPVG